MQMAEWRCRRRLRPLCGRVAGTPSPAQVTMATWASRAAKTLSATFALWRTYTAPGVRTRCRPSLSSFARRTSTRSRRWSESYGGASAATIYPTWRRRPPQCAFGDAFVTRLPTKRKSTRACLACSRARFTSRATGGRSAWHSCLSRSPLPHPLSSRSSRQDCPPAASSSRRHRPARWCCESSRRCMACHNQLSVHFQSDM
mmetsp:Transcript_29377/g.94778  ORF Transcript_29377/g.94778 Transcript_29377/m.94778 type:complete len:201 (-) Transcript_29377:811-1413(-)